MAATLPWQRRRAQSFSYSNSNYIALGLIVERLRRRPLADVLWADVGQPLGLGGTRLTDDGPVPEDMVHGYTLIDGEPVDTAYAALHSGSAGIGLVSTMADLNTFFDALLDGHRRLALAVAYPPWPEGTNAIAAGMTQLAEDALNGSCRLGGGVSFGQWP